MKIDLLPFFLVQNLEISCTATREKGELCFQFSVAGNTMDLVIGVSESVGKLTNDLSQKSCFKLFIGLPRHTNYVEWSLSSEGEYSINGFQEVLKHIDAASQSRAEDWLKPSRFSCRRSKNSIKCDFSISLRNIHNFIGHPKWFIKPAAILRTTLGGSQHWAPQHAADKPDFHEFNGLEELDPYAWGL